MNIYFRSAYVVGAITFVIWLWNALPLDRFPEGSPAMAIKVRFIGFIVVTIITFFFVLKAVIEKKDNDTSPKKNKKNKLKIL